MNKTNYTLQGDGCKFEPKYQLIMSSDPSDIHKYNLSIFTYDRFLPAATLLQDLVSLWNPLYGRARNRHYDFLICLARARPRPGLDWTGVKVGSETKARASEKFLVVLSTW